MQLSARSAIAPFQVMDILQQANQRAAAGESILHLEAGEPGGSMPELIRRAAEEALAHKRIGYTEPTGLPALRARIAAFYGERYSLDIAPSRVIVTMGASGAFLLAFTGLFDPGARVALAEPGYPAYRNLLSVMGLTPVILNATAATRYQPTPEMVHRAGPLNGLLLQTPSNPTGTMLRAPELEALVAEASTRDLWLIADEIYHGITFETPADTALRFSDDVVVINSFSKYFCMTGWRIGWMIVPERAARAIELLTQSFFISPNALSQYAALAAFDAREELDRRVECYRINRDILMAALKAAGVDSLVKPDGAFYLYADFRAFTNNAEDFCARLLADTGVAATPGTDFDPINGHASVRLSFAGAEGDIRKATERLVPWLKAARIS